MRCPQLAKSRCISCSLSRFPWSMASNEWMNVRDDSDTITANCCTRLDLVHWVSVGRKRHVKLYCLQFLVKTRQWRHGPDTGDRHGVPGTCGHYWKRSVAKCRLASRLNSECWRTRRPQSVTSARFSEVRRCHAMQTAVCQNTQLVLYPLWNFQPVQFTEVDLCVPISDLLPLSGTIRLGKTESV